LVNVDGVDWHKEKETKMDLETQNQVLNALVMLTRLLQEQEPVWYLKKHDKQAVAAIEKAIGRPLENGLVCHSALTECEITESVVTLSDGAKPFDALGWSRCNCTIADPAECRARAFAANNLMTYASAIELIQKLPGLVCYCTCHKPMKGALHE
jgi:hypothetical protein